MKTKKSLALVLIFALIVTSFIITTVASADETKIEMTINKTEISAGETATVSVKVTTNYPVATMSIPVFYDKTLVEVSGADAALSAYAVENVTTDKQSVDLAKVYVNTGLSESNCGFVLVTYIGEANQQLANSIDTVVLTFNITAKENVSGDAVVKVIEDSAKTEDNIQGMLYFGKSGTVLDDIPENVENIDVTSATTKVKISEAQPPTLEKVEEFEYADFVVVDTTNTNYDEFTGIIYGIDTLDQNEMMEQLATLADALKASTGDETHIRITPNDQGVESTGAIIEIVDSDENVLETYVFVYFGDVDGDGMISGSDGFIAEEYEITYEGIESYAAYVAADVDGDGMVSGSDGFAMAEYEITYMGIDYQYNLGQNAQYNMYEWIY